MFSGFCWERGGGRETRLNTWVNIYPFVKMDEEWINLVYMLCLLNLATWTLISRPIKVNKYSPN